MTSTDGSAPVVRLASNPFHAGWAVAAAIGRLVPKGSVRWIGGDGGRLPVTQQQLLGRLPLPHTAGLSHDHCFAGYPDLRGDPAAGLGAVIRAANGPLLSLTHVPADNVAHDALCNVPGAVILSTRHRVMLRSDADYDEYVAAAIKAETREKLRRLKARLEDEGTPATSVSDGKEGLETWTGEFLDLERSGREGTQGTAMGKRDSERAYLTLLLEGGRDAGALRLFRLSLNDRPMAMAIAFVGGDGGLYLYKITHDPAWDRYSPGVMIVLALTRHVLGAGDLTYADSCAREGDEMVEQLWSEQRILHDWAVPTGPAGRLITTGLVRAGKARRP